ncbi:hypothetical protein Syun_001817 [Stephania yunnanensis]|uniref:Major facilitator superfamily (MFS) profile domain-containing protein n=1 Tax=Stephania yunnanensis TaxID=152371 RepID=A0AAP0LED3_9MAGN
MSESKLQPPRLHSEHLGNVLFGKQALLDVSLLFTHLQNDMEQGATRPPWTYSFPHVLVATISSFLFGYHLGVINEPLETISLDLGFSGNTLAEGLVVSTCLGGAFVGSLLSGWIADEIGRRRALQVSALPMIVGASLRLCALFSMISDGFSI